jgi:hypothetical protein
VEGSASSVITGTVAAIAADVVTRGGTASVRPPEAALDPAQFLDALNERRSEGKGDKMHVVINDTDRRL